MSGQRMFLQGWIRRHAVIAVALLVCAGTVTDSLRAQFSGPALTLPTQAAETPVPNVDAALLAPKSNDILIGAGDVIAIQVFGSAEFTPIVKVSADGTIQLPLIGLLPIAGLTVEHAEDLIAQRLIAAGMYKNPQVLVEVTVAANQYATITGEMHAVVPLIGERRLLDVLSMAASGSAGGGGVSMGGSNVGGSGLGFPATASHIITIIRQGVPQPIVVDLGTDPARSAAANIVIQPHDLIVLSRVGLVYIVGAFAKQGAIPLDQNSPLTLLQAAALSGGTGFEGRFEDMRIIRTDGLKRTMVKVDIKRILRGRAPDPILEANDIVFLPTNLIKAALKGGGISVLTSIADVALIAFRP